MTAPDPQIVRELATEHILDDARRAHDIGAAVLGHHGPDALTKHEYGAWCSAVREAIATATIVVSWQDGQLAAEQTAPDRTDVDAAVAHVRQVHTWRAENGYKTSDYDDDAIATLLAELEAAKAERQPGMGYLAQAYASGWADAIAAHRAPGWADREASWRKYRKALETGMAKVECGDVYHRHDDDPLVCTLDQDHIGKHCGRGAEWPVGHDFGDRSADLAARDEREAGTTCAFPGCVHPDHQAVRDGEAGR